MALTRIGVAGGRPVMVKEEGPGEGGDRLRREAEVLAAAAHPGVVELVALDELDDGKVALRTAFVGGGTLTGLISRVGAAPDPGRSATLVAGVAATLADLHARGVVHARLTADHVLVGRDDRPVLCGLGGAALPRDAGPGPLPADDVAAVSRLASGLVEGATGPVARAVRAAAARGGAAEPAARPSMAVLAASLRASAPDTPARDTPARVDPARVDPAQALGPDDRSGDAHGAEAATPPRGTPRVVLARHRPGTHRRRRARLAAGGVVAAAAVAAGVVVGGQMWAARRDGAARPPTGPAGASEAAAPTRSPQATSTTTVPAPERVWPAPTCPPPAAGPITADVDGDGCADAVTLADGVVSAAGRRWSVGVEGDVVALGDWDCDGRATPAVVRPGEGSAWVFDAWAEPGVDVKAEPAGAVPGAVAARGVDPDGDGCHLLEVTDAGGDTSIVRPAG